MQTYLKKFSNSLFLDLKANEDLGLFLHSEDSLFLRFNGSKIRQNTTVSQHEITLSYQTDQKMMSLTFNLTLDFDTDLHTALKKLAQVRIDIQMTDASPKFFEMINNGQSETLKKVERPKDHEIPNMICDLFFGSDLAGLWCSGPLRRASINSKGQFHYFESDYFFFDYSLYSGPKAAKGFYSDDLFHFEKLKANAAETKKKLSLLQKPTVQVPRGQYRAYLEPMAVAEILGTMSWGALGQANLQQGRSPLKKLTDHHLSLSENFTLKENFNLGFHPLFNSIGEISKPEVLLIENGKLKNLLTSTATAKEYGLVSNQASNGESLRSPEIRAGALDQNQILNKLGTGLYLSNLHYINWSDLQSARMTGMTRFACYWVENGEIVGPINDLRFDDTIYNIFGEGLVDFSQHQEIFVDTSTYLKRSIGAMKVPGALINNFNFVL